MNPRSKKRIALRSHFIGFMVVAGVVHLLAVWAAPRLIMRVIIHKIAAPAEGVLHAPPITAAARSIVMPSPDMLYSICTFNVSKGPLHITANPGVPSYWSIALYASNSDNFYVMNDRQAQGKPVDLRLVSASDADAVKPGSIIAPTDTGVLLMRTLTGNYMQEKPVLEPARRTLQCTPLKIG